jgi:hypothetical protein
MKIEGRLALAGLILVAALPAGAEDLTIVSQSSHGDSAPTTRTTYMTDSRMRMSSGEGTDTMMDYASGAVTVVNNKKKEYFVITPADMEAMAAKMKEMQAKMQAAMQNMPPALRERMQGSMGAAAQDVKVEKGSGGRTIAGYPCENWNVTIGSVSHQETCLTTKLQFPVRALEGMKAMARPMQGMGMGGGMTAMWEKFAEMKGFPLASTDTTTIMGRTQTTKTEVTEIRKGPVPDSLFQIPAGYKKVDAPMSKMGRPD